MSVRMSWRMSTATIGPKTPPRPPARLTPPRTTAATLSRVYGPGTGVPIPVLAVRLRPASAANRPPIAYAIDLRAADRHAAPEGRQPVAADRVDRQAEPRPPERDPDRPRRRRAARPPPWGSTRCRPTRLTRSLSQSAAPPPGRCRTSSAQPAQTNDIASVTTMSGTRVRTTRRAVDRAEDEAEQQDAEDDDDAELLALVLHERRRDDAGQRHHRADRQVDAARDHDDRLGDRRERERQDRDRQALDAG